MKYNLSEAEYEIMQFIWENGNNTSFSDVMEYTHKKGHTWKKQTVQTFLTRLIDKKVLKAEKIGNKRYYSPVGTEAEHIHNWTHDLLDIDFGGSLKNFMLAFTGGRSLSEAEAKELHEFLDE